MKAMRVRKILAGMMIVILCLGLTGGGVWAKGKPANPGMGKVQINQVNPAQNQGQVMKYAAAIKVRGMSLKFELPPVIKQGRTLIPVRAVMNGLGAEVSWDQATGVVTISRDGKVIEMNLRTGEVKIDGVVVTTDVPPELIDSRTYVPLRFIAETFGLKVAYDDATGDIDIADEPEVPEAEEEEVVGEEDEAVGEDEEEEVVGEEDEVVGEGEDEVTDEDEAIEDSSEEDTEEPVDETGDDTGTGTEVDDGAEESAQE